MPATPDSRNAVVLNIFPGDILEIWIAGKTQNQVWAMVSSSEGALFVGESAAPIKGISDKHWKFVVREQKSLRGRGKTGRGNEMKMTPEQIKEAREWCEKATPSDRCLIELGTKAVQWGPTILDDLEEAHGLLAELWGTTCPDCGPDDYKELVEHIKQRWYALSLALEAIRGGAK